jgi:hypothetical protein
VWITDLCANDCSNSDMTATTSPSFFSRLADLLAGGLPLFAVASLTLGLAPFAPEPHIWEKIRWAATGVPFDQSIYYVDVLLHGTPWLLLFISLGIRLARKLRKN